MNVNKKWRKSEGGVVGRYGDPRRALKSVALVLSDSEVNPAKQSFEIDPGHRLSELRPRLIPQIDYAMLNRLSDEMLDSVGICLVLRDRSIKRFSLIGSWKLDQIPESIALDGVPQFDRIVKDRMVLSVGLSVLDDRSQLEVGTSLARKDFSIHTEVNGNQFPHQFVQPTYFEEQGLPKATSWFVHLLSEDGDRSAEETFIVYINKDIAEVASSKGADAVWASLAADVFSILMQRLLRADFPEEPVPGSILDHLDRLLSSQNLSMHTVSQWVQAGELSKVVAVAQAITKVNVLLKGAL